MNYKKHIQLLLGIVSSGVLLWLALSKIELSVVMDNVWKTNVMYLSLGVMAVFTSLFFRGVLWKALLHMGNAVSLYQFFKSVVIGYMGNIVLPFRGGELLKIHSIKKADDVRSARVIASIAVEKLLDIIALIVLTGLFSLVMDIPAMLKKQIVVMSVVGAGALSMLIFFSQTTFLNRMIDKCLMFVPERFREKVREILNNMMYGLSFLKNKGSLLSVIGLSFMCWFMIYVGIFFALKAYHIEANWMMPLALLVILNIGLTAPIPPYLGIYPFFSVMALGFFGIDKSVAVGFAIVLQTMDFIPPMLLGVVFFFEENILLTFNKNDGKDKRMLDNDHYERSFNGQSTVS